MDKKWLKDIQYDQWRSMPLRKRFTLCNQQSNEERFSPKKTERIFIFLFDDTTTHIHIDFIRILEMERMRYLFKLNTRRIRNDKVEVKKEWTFDVKFRIFWEKLREKNVLLRRYIAKTHYEKWEIRKIKKKNYILSVQRRKTWNHNWKMWLNAYFMTHLRVSWNLISFFC